MTIIAGFRATNGIVLCSDTQETSGPSKRDVPKLRLEQRGVLSSTPIAVAFCGAGYGPLIDKVVDECWKAVEPLESLDDVCDTIESTIKHLYKEYGEIYQQGQCPYAELIYGVKAAEGAKLFVAHGPIVNEKEDYCSCGMGYYMADFLASRMYQTYLTVHQCAILAAYILFQAKEHVDGCGGQSHIAVLRSDNGADGLVDATRVEAITEILKGFDVHCGQITLRAADFDLTKSQIEEEIKDLGEGLLYFRGLSQDKIKQHEENGIEKILGGILGTTPFPKDALGLPIYPKKTKIAD